MGYANIAQIGKGLHLRQFARAFVVVDDNGSRVAFVSVDSGMMGFGVKQEVCSSMNSPISYEIITFCIFSALNGCKRVMAHFTISTMLSLVELIPIVVWEVF